ncbi:MAG: VWA domain-containing protein [Pirellulales bacterium]
MFVDFLYHLRDGGLKVTSTEWLALMRALEAGHARGDLNTFYHLARCLLVKRESDYDTYDRAFASFFSGIEGTALSDELLDWLRDPVLPEISDEDRAKLRSFDLDELDARFRKLLAEQRERHDGGNRYVGTGGTSPFGHGGEHPTGIRVGGGGGGGRSAVQVADSRRYRNLRSDRILDTRQISLALRRLKRLDKDEGPEELLLDDTIDHSARNGGEIELVFGPPRRNRIKLLLLMDVGGSMDPHTHLCERLFSAAHAANHFKKFDYRFFHNCVYRRLYTDMRNLRGEPTGELLKRLDHTWSVVFVGDAWMAPSELTHVGGAIDYDYRNTTTGLEWLQRLRQRVPNSLWLNPEPRRHWNEPSIRLIRRVYPMFELSIDGLTEAVDVLRGARPNRPGVG